MHAWRAHIRYRLCVGRADSLSVVEAAYARAPNEEAWLGRVAQAIAENLDGELGAAAWFIDFLPGVDAKPRCSTFVSVGSCEPRVVEYVRTLHGRDLPPPLGALVYGAAYGHGRVVAGARELMGPVFDAVNPQGHERTGATDCLAVQCFDAEGRGVALALPSPTTVRTTDRRRRTWERIASHVSAGLRLQRIATSGDLGSADALLDAHGRVCHAKGDEAAASAGRLREAAIRADRARTREGRRDVDAALGMWECLVAGEYSVVDTFDTDGKRYFVARKNAPAARAVRALSTRERQVVSLLALGHSDKWIAYELGIGEGTVAAAIHTALRKLGVKRSGDLAAVRHALGAATPEEPGS